MQRGTSLVLLALSLLATSVAERPAHSHAAPPLTDDEFYSYWIPFQATFRSIQEVKPIADLAATLGVRVWFFGGATTSIAVEAKRNQINQRENQVSLSAIQSKPIVALLRPSQDIDIVVDGPVEAIALLETEVKRLYPYVKEYQSAWEFRSLREVYNGKPAVATTLVGETQHTDSLPTTLIEITQAPGMAGYPSVIDLKEGPREGLYWYPGNSRGDGAHNPPLLIQSVIKGRAQFLPAPLHRKSEGFKRHDNPEILSVLRILNKSFAHSLPLDSASEAEIKDIIEAFQPKTEVLSAYARTRIESEAIKILANARDIDQAWNYLEKTGLRSKLMDLQTQIAPGAESSKKTLLTYWMSLEPLLFKNRAAVSLDAQKPLPSGESHLPTFISRLLTEHTYKFSDRGILRLAQIDATAEWNAFTPRVRAAYTQQFQAMRPKKFGSLAANWTYLPSLIALGMITKSDENEARSQLRRLLGATNSLAPAQTEVCGEAFLIAEYFLGYATQPQDYFDLLSLPENHPCQAYFESLWLEHLPRFVNTEPSAKQINQARRAGGFQTSTKLLHLTVRSRVWNTKEFYELMDPLWETPADHPYTREMTQIWGKNLHRYFWNLSHPYPLKTVLERFRQTPAVPLGRLLELFIGFGNPNTEEPFRYSFELAPLVVDALKKNPVELASALDGIFNALERLDPNGWDTNHLMTIRNSFSGSRLASTYFINRFANLVNLDSPEIEALFFSPSPQPTDAPEWAREISIIKKKALAQRVSKSGDCNAALE